MPTQKKIWLYECKVNEIELSDDYSKKDKGILKSFYRKKIRDLKDQK